MLNYASLISAIESQGTISNLVDAKEIIGFFIGSHIDFTNFHIDTLSTDVLGANTKTIILTVYTDNSKDIITYGVSKPLEIYNGEYNVTPRGSISNFIHCNGISIAIMPNRMFGLCFFNRNEKTKRISNFMSLLRVNNKIVGCVIKNTYDNVEGGGITSLISEASMYLYPKDKESDYYKDNAMNKEMIIDMFTKQKSLPLNKNFT